MLRSTRRHYYQATAASKSNLTSKWDKHRKLWQVRFPWLVATRSSDDTVLGIGCAMCAASASIAPLTPWGRCEIAGLQSLQPSAFQKHADSRLHSSAMKAFDSEMGPLGAEVLAPTEAEFIQVLTALWKGTSVTENAGRFKFRKMLWCLSEGYRQNLREALKNAEVISIQQDARDNLLSIGFTCVDRQLNVTSGFLGAADLTKDGFDLTAKGIYYGMVYAISKFCYTCPVVCGAGEEATFHAQVFQNIKDRVEVFASDAASDETLAGKLATKFFPHLWVQQWDKAHACQRLLSRPWKADPFLSNICESLFEGKHAVASKIHHSGVFRERFRRAVAQMTGKCRSKIRDLSAAKHRFTSHSLPLRRACLYFLPLQRVAQSILDERARGSEEFISCQTFLESLSGEVCFQMALMADASDEVIVSTRFFDTSNFDKAEMAGTLEGFLTRASFLFEKKGADQCGCTRHMLEMLRTPRRCVVDGNIKSIECPTSIERDRCYARMVNWLRLVKQCIEADFPSFETIQLFQALSLNRQCSAEKIERLAHCLEVDAGALQVELEHVRPIAAFHYGSADEAHRSTSSAWATALQGKVKQYPSLFVAVSRLLAWQTSTSDVERLFSKTFCTLSPCRAETRQCFWLLCFDVLLLLLHFYSLLY